MKISRASYGALLSKNEKLLFNIAGTVSIWDISEENSIEKHRFNTLKNPNYIALSSDEQLLAYSNTSGHIVISEIETGKLIAKNKCLNKEGHNIIFFDGDKKILSSTWDGEVFSWDIYSGEVKLIKELPIILTKLFEYKKGSKVIVEGANENAKEDARYRMDWEMSLTEEFEIKEIPIQDVNVGKVIYTFEDEIFTYFGDSETEDIIHSINMQSMEIKEILNVHHILGMNERLLIKYGYYTSACMSKDKKYLLLGFSGAVIGFDLIKKECIGIVRFKDCHVVSNLSFFDNDTKLLIGTWHSVQSVNFPEFFTTDIKNSKADYKRECLGK